MTDWRYEVRYTLDCWRRMAILALPFVLAFAALLFYGGQDTP